MEDVSCLGVMLAGSFLLRELNGRLPAGGSSTAYNLMLLWAFVQEKRLRAVCSGPVDPAALCPLLELGAAFAF